MSISTSTALTNQFYQWEQRGRGWFVAEETVSLEPAFEPFWGHFLESTIIDDGKRPSWGEAFFSNSANEPQADAVASPPDSAFPFDDSDIPLAIFSVTIPRQFKPSLDRMEQLLIMLSYRKSPMSFEIIGSAEKISLQWSCREPDREYLYIQLQSFFPELGVQETKTDLLEDLLYEKRAFYTADFGLAEEFMRPTNSTAALDHDPYTPFFGMLEQLHHEQQLALQIFFSGTHNAWVESIMTAVCDNSGKGSFFFDDPDMPRLAKEKIARPLLGAAMRVVTCADAMHDALSLLEHAVTTVIHASLSPYNSLMPLMDNPSNPRYPVEERLADILMRQTHRVGMLLNCRELLTFVHFPGPALQTQKLMQATRSTKAAPPAVLNHSYCFGVNVHQGVEQRVGISAEQRARHIHIMGATGTGKSTLLHSLMMQDIVQGNGLLCLDPHGDLITSVLNCIPQHRIQDVVLIDPSDSAFPVGFNILSAHSEIEKELLASDLVALFKRFSTSWGDQMNSILANAIMALVYNTRSFHLGDLRKFLIESAYRSQVLATATDSDILYYWQKEFPIVKGGSIGSIMTRLDSFLRPKVIRAMVCQTQGLDMARLMDSKKIILVKLSQGLIGAENSFLLGAFIVSKLQQTAMSRQSQAVHARIPFYCYIDEFQYFVTPSMASILSGARKYSLGLILAHQDVAQVSKSDSDIAGSVLSNAGTRICFRLGDTDARRMQEGFASFTAEDLQNLQTGEAIARVTTADGDFTLDVMPYEPETDENYTQQIIEHSRKTYSASIPLSEATRVQSPPLTTDVPQLLKEALPKSPIEPLAENTPKQEVREHRHMQTFIKKLAEEYGYKAQLEVPTPDSQGQVDVLLEKDGQTIAVEISVTTTAEWELHNIQKCLASGYGQIIVCTKDTAKQKRLARLVQTDIPEAQQSYVHIVNPESIQSFLLPQEQVVPKETTIKGYRVKVNYEATADRSALLQRIVSATRKP